MPCQAKQVCRVQSLFDSLGDEKTGKIIGLGGDGRYFNKEAAQKIIKLAAANGIKKVTRLSSISLSLLTASAS